MCEDDCACAKDYTAEDFISQQAVGGVRQRRVTSSFRRGGAGLRARLRQQLELGGERPSGRTALSAMEAVPRMPMIWLDLKEAGDFHFQSAVKKVSPPLPRISVVCPRVTPPARLSLPGLRRQSGQAFSLRLALSSRARTPSLSPAGAASCWEPAFRRGSRTTCPSAEAPCLLAVTLRTRPCPVPSWPGSPHGQAVWRSRLCRVHARPEHWWAPS